MNSTLPETFAIGKVVRPQGLTGEVKIQPWTDNPGQWLDFSHCLLKEGNAFVTRKLLSVRVQGEFVYAMLEGVRTREEGEALRDEELYLERSVFPELEEGSWYIADLVGCEVSDDRGKHLGVMADVLTYPANDVYVVGTAKGQVLVPALKSVLSRVDIPGRRVIFSAARLREVAEFEN